MPIAKGKLEDSATIALLRDALRLGLPYTEACRASGIAPVTFYRWRDQSAQAEEILQGREVVKCSEAELRKLAKACEMSDKPRKNTKLSKSQHIASRKRILTKKVALLRNFRVMVDSAEPEAKKELLAQLERGVKGGKVITEVEPDGTVVRRGVRSRTVTVKRRRVEVLLDDGTKTTDWEDVERIETIEEKELPPDRLSIANILAWRWPTEFGRRKAIDPLAGEDVQEQGRRLVASAQAMFSTVPPSALALGDGTERLVAEVSAMTDQEVEAELARLTSAAARPRLDSAGA